ncbi:hypothetical protein [Erwinia aphidicola]|uniref:hypothetical protein n=1 Tax=Erwinia aphidicola TaxID=68334 RepID=UPI003BB057C6
MHADLPGKLNYLWRAGSGSLKAQNDLYRLQHALNAVKMTGWVYMVLSEREWSGRNRTRLNPAVSGIYINRAALENGFDDGESSVTRFPRASAGTSPGWTCC